MPELPEVETVRRGLTPVMVGRRFVRVEQRRPDLRTPFPERFVERLTGRTVVRLDRRAKYLIAGLDDGQALIIHLGMSGRLTVRSSGEIGSYLYSSGSNPAHDHVVFHLDGGEVILYNDARRFGLMDLGLQSELASHPLLAGLGLEPLGADFVPEYLAAAAAGRRCDLKALLLDQRVIAGLGNIYVAEALFRAGLAPTRASLTISGRRAAARARSSALVAAIRSVLGEAIAAGGSTLRDYQRVDGSAGGFQGRFTVYGREGEPCITPDCRGIVRRNTQAGRSTFHCPACQL